MRNYFIHISVATLIASIAFASFNWLVDPFKIWHPPTIHGVNTFQFRMPDIERSYKIIGLAHRPAQVAILGTSRSDIGLNPNHPALGQDATNLGFSGQSYRETRMLYEFLSDHKTNQTFVIGLDFFPSNVFFPPPDEFVGENFKPTRKWQLLFSGSTLVSSAISVARFKTSPGDTWSDNGLRLWSDEYVKSANGHRRLMRESERMFLTVQYAPLPTCTFSFESTNGQLSPLDEIRAIFSRAHREHTDLKLFISPSHAKQWETLATAGLWDKWEEWKHRLVQMNLEEAQRASQQPFLLWDFSGYNSITTEAVPALGDVETKMHWYFDSSHYTPATGDLVLDRIFNYKFPSRTVPEDFGVILNGNNIDAHLASIRQARENYRRRHPEDVAEIEEIAREVVKTKHCHVIQN